MSLYKEYVFVRFFVRFYTFFALKHFSTKLYISLDICILYHSIILLLEYPSLLAKYLPRADAFGGQKHS